MAHTAHLAIALVTLTACGGGVFSAPDASAEASLGPEFFVCKVVVASGPQYIECLTLPDGGPTYTDSSANVDCRVFAEDAGHGCTPPMSCQASVDDVMVAGTCVQAP